MKNLPHLFDIQRILPYITANSLILTPNNRLRSKILQAWGGHQTESKHKVWPTPRIQVIDQWFNEQWEHLQAQGYMPSAQTIIKPEQQQVLWEKITNDCGLMQTEAIAKQASNAFTTLARWNQPIKRHLLDAGINEQFAQWIHEFQQHLSAMDSITPEHSYHIIGNAFDEGIIPQEDTIYLLGFDDISPLLKEQLDKASPKIEPLPGPSYSPKSIQRLSFDNADLEMQSAAQWARRLLEDDNEKQQGIRIGIIVPNLGQCRKRIELAFSSEFEAHSFSPNTERYTLPFNLSAGTPLGDTPLIASSLQLLQLQNSKQEWNVEFLVHCLLSPFWGRYSAEQEHRCALATKLQSMGVFTITGDNLRYWAQRIDERFEHAPSEGLFNYFNTFHQFSTALGNKGKHLPSKWVELFLQQLDILYWPGERTPDSQEYQQTQLWYQLLETFAHLDKVLGNINSHQALKQLQQMANQLPFQAKVPDSPIQILGILEGAGLHFTHCWVMGLNQQAWPPAPSPNSLLPIRLQREHNMPHASSLRELAYAQSLTDNYRHCADTIIFSSPNHKEDSEQSILPSQLISDIPLAELSTQTATDSLSSLEQRLQESQDLELILCEQAPAFNETQLPGGSGFFKAQSENPFDTFAKYRLGAQAPIEAMNGFSHIEKGNILHNSLAAIWQKLTTQTALLALEEQPLKNLVEEQVNEAIADIQRHKPKHLHPTLCQIESERQCHLVQQWLNYEKTRAPFTVVAIEQAQTVHFKGVDINIRIDRVDQLQDGQFLIIDYKTGESNINAWKGERPKEPQLPLYALTYGKPVKGISFAQININAQTFKGLGEADIAQGINSIEKNRADLPTNWESALHHWEGILSQLLSEFQQGHCANRYLDEVIKSYAKDYLRINRFFEAQAIEQLMTTNINDGGNHLND